MEKIVRSVFSSKIWDNSINAGDTIDAVVRQSFRWFGLENELDGLIVNVDIDFDKAGIP